MNPSINAIPPRSIKITASGGSPIPTTYTTNSQSRVFIDIAYADRLMVINETGGRVAVNVSANSTTPPSTGDGELFCFANGITTYDELAVSQTIYLRSDSGSTITSGTVEIMVW
jgi:hypothetical protein